MREHKAAGEALTLVHISMHADVEISVSNDGKQPSAGVVQADINLHRHSAFIEHLLCAEAFAGGGKRCNKA